MNRLNKKIIDKICNPIENLFFTGIVLKSTPSDAERIKHFILEETSARLIYQHQDIAYLKIIREEANPNEKIS